MRRLTSIVAVTLSIWMGVGDCSKGKEDRSPDAWADLFFELAQATQECGADTVALRAKHEELLRAHQVSPAEVEQFLEECRQHPERWVPILQRMVEKHREGKKAEKRQVPQ